MLPSRSATCSARAQLAPLVELGAALGRGEQLAGVRRRVRRADGHAEAGQLEVATGALVRLIGPASRDAAERGHAGDDERRRWRRAAPGDDGSRARRRGRLEEHRHGAVGAGDDGVVAGVDAERPGAGDPLEQLDLAAQRHDAVLHRDDDRRRHVDLAEPFVERNAPIAPPASRIIRQSCRAACSTAHGDHVAVLRCRGTTGSSASARAWAGVSRASAAEAAQPEERQPVVAAGLEPRRPWRPARGPRRRRVALPQQLGDGAAHRVADGDDGSVDLERVEQRGDVVGAVLEPERRRDCGCPSRGRGGRRRGRGSARRAPRSTSKKLRSADRRPAVQQDDGRRAGRSGDLAQSDGARRELDVAAVGQRWAAGAGAPTTRSSSGPSSASAAVAGAARSDCRHLEDADRSSAPVGVS